MKIKVVLKVINLTVFITELKLSLLGHHGTRRKGLGFVTKVFVPKIVTIGGSKIILTFMDDP